MSIVGTRPPLPNEWEAYELHHRARLAMCLVNLNQWKALIANHYRWMQ